MVMVITHGCEWHDVTNVVEHVEVHIDVQRRAMYMDVQSCTPDMIQQCKSIIYGDSVAWLVQILHILNKLA
jgi:hypothetical protein